MIKFFYDHFEAGDVKGLFSVDHLIYFTLFLTALILLLFISRRTSTEQIRKLHIGLAVSVTLAEITKITLRIIKQQPADSWLPLYFCSLFIYSLWLSFSKYDFIKTMGYSYMAIGGIIGGVCFMIFPSTSIGLFPIWHPSSIFSLIYHLTMVYFGIMLLWKKVYVPKMKHLFHYFTLILIASAISLILNHTLDANCMFLRHAYGLGVLQSISDSHPVIYAILAIFAQGVLAYSAGVGIYKFYLKMITKRKDRHEFNHRSNIR